MTVHWEYTCNSESIINRFNLLTFNNVKCNISGIDLTGQHFYWKGEGQYELTMFGDTRFRKREFEVGCMRYLSVV